MRGKGQELELFLCHEIAIYTFVRKIHIVPHA
jgi:hypothetical protein